MADTSKINRTWLCSVVFLDIVNYSSQSVELQIKWKDRFNSYLGKAIKDVPEDERVILDTGDGAAACFLGAPEVAMFAALELWHSVFVDEREQQPPFRVRIGINLGPVKLVRDINGAPNALGDGINAGQRVMSFAGENQILVSQSFFEVVSRLSDDYKNLFTLKGVEKDKHIREHTVYHLSPPGAQHAPGPVTTAQQATHLPGAASYQPAASPERVAETAPEKGSENKARGNRSVPLLVGGIAVVVVAAAAAWHFASAPAPVKESPAPSAATTPAVPSRPSPQNPAAPIATAPPAPSTPAPGPSASKTRPPESPSSAPPVVTLSSSPRLQPAVASTPVANTAVEPPAPPKTDAVSAADRETARDLRERYASDASRAAIARRNAEEIRRNLAAKGMSLNAQTAAAVDRMQLLLDEAAEAIRDHNWDDALSSLQAVEATTQKVNSAVGN